MSVVLCECFRHDGLMPMAALCVHVFEGDASAVVTVETEGQEVLDYVCPRCAKWMRRGRGLDIRFACMHCSRLLAGGLPVAGRVTIGESKPSSSGEGDFSEDDRID